MNDMTPVQLDVLKELINIGIGRAASTLNEVTGSHISLEVPFVEVSSLPQIKKEMAKEISSLVSVVRLNFKGTFSGMASLILPTDSADELVASLIGEELEDSDFDKIKIGTFTEIGNIVLNGVMGSIANMVDQEMSYSVPTYEETTISNLLGVDDSESDKTILMAQTRFIIEQLEIDGDFTLLFKVDSPDVLVKIVDAMIGFYLE